MISRISSIWPNHTYNTTDRYSCKSIYHSLSHPFRFLSWVYPNVPNRKAFDSDFTGKIIIIIFIESYIIDIHELLYVFFWISVVFSSKAKFKSKTYLGETWFSRLLIQDKYLLFFGENSSNHNYNYFVRLPVSDSFSNYRRRAHPCFLIIWVAKRIMF